MNFTFRLVEPAVIIYEIYPDMIWRTCPSPVKDELFIRKAKKKLAEPYKNPICVLHLI
jgi:hypothetical protein